MKLAIADPPYPPAYGERRDRPGGPIRVTVRSRARRYYGNGTRPGNERPADFHPAAGEWDRPARHRLLLEELLDTYDGWAIATTPDGLDCYRPLPIPCRVMAWVKLTGNPGNHRLASKWEAVITYVPEARRRAERPGMFSDVLIAEPPGVGFHGAKPERWTRWVLDALGYDPDVDELVDLFPGTGAVATAAAQGVIL